MSDLRERDVRLAAARISDEHLPGYLIGELRDLARRGRLARGRHRASVAHGPRL
jgi:hypothetical protein